MKYTRRTDNQSRRSEDLDIIGSRKSRRSSGELNHEQFLFEDYDLNEDLGGIGSSGADRLYRSERRTSSESPARRRASQSRSHYEERNAEAAERPVRRSSAQNVEGRARAARPEAGAAAQRARMERAQMADGRRRTARPEAAGTAQRTRSERAQTQEGRARTARPETQGTAQRARAERAQSQEGRTRSSRPETSAAAQRSRNEGAQSAERPLRGYKTAGKSGKPKKTLKKDIFGIIMLALQGALSVALIVVLSILDVLPIGYFILLVAILLILWGFVFFTQFKRYKKLPLIGKIFSIVLCIVLIVGNYYMIITNKAIDKVTEDVAYNIDYIDVVVMANDPAQKIEDAADYTFGTQATFEPINLNTAINDIEDAIGKEPKTKDYVSALNQCDALYSGEVKAIIYNRDFVTAMEERHPNYDEETRVIMTITIKEEVDIKANSNVDVTTQPFLFYISGNDEYGDISISGRTDVNMLIAVNPVSRQVLMINTPRDYYVELPGVSGGMRDKLTHSGVYGVQCQIDTMSALYGYDVDYYCKVNFSSLIDIINALGGIDLYNPYEFQFSYSDTVFPEGMIHLGGWDALEYCRERESLEDGDNERGRHQQMVIEAIINKLLSSAGFTAYSQLIKTLEKCCITNMPKEGISALVKKQLAEGGGWTITKASAEGGGMMQATFSMGDMGLYVTMPYAQSIRNIQEMLRALYAGEEVVALQMSENDDFTYIAEPGPVPEVYVEEDETEETASTEAVAPEPVIDDGGGEDTGGDGGSVEPIDGGSVEPIDGGGEGGEGGEGGGDGGGV